MAMVDEILSQISPDDLASRLGTDPDTAMDAARKALPALLGGLSMETNTGQGDALGAALVRDHDGSLLDLSDPLNAVDTTDGEKIVGHIFGDQRNQVVDRLGASSRAGSGIFAKLLPLLAPLVMAWLAKRLGGALGGGSSLGSGQTAQGGGLGGILGGLLGGGGGGQGGSGGGLGGLLGGLLGGGGSGNAAGQATNVQSEGGGGESGGLGGLLGGLLGREVETERSAAPDLGDLFDMFGGAEPRQE